MIGETVRSVSRQFGVCAAVAALLAGTATAANSTVELDPLAPLPAVAEKASLPTGLQPVQDLPIAPTTPAPMPILTGPPPSLPLAAVGAVYNRYRLSIWFQGGQPRPAARQLIDLLRRAPLDGLQHGAFYADQVEQALRAAQTGAPPAIATADQMLSAAWVLYVQALRKPTPRMIYAYPSLQPQGAQLDLILRAAATARSIEQHVRDVSSINRIYSQLREAAWAQAQSGQTPDPRLIANMERARSLPATGRFIMVDVATQRLWMYENGQPIDSMKVIVGMDELPTPLIASIIHYTTFNPYWNVPEHLVRKTIAPHVLNSGLIYLRRGGYQVMSDWTDAATVIPSDSIDWKEVAAGRLNIRVRQLPGPTNSMGDLKFSFPNGEGIYLHDTPSKDLFSKNLRTLSNGCVRVEDARRLAHWLLGKEPVAPSPEPEQFVPLPQGVPIYITYLTAQPTNGEITFAPDIYGWDSNPAFSRVAFRTQ